MVKNKAFILFFTMIALLVGAIIFSVQMPEEPGLHLGTTQTKAVVHRAQDDLYTVHVDEVSFEVSVAGNKRDRTQGLSGVGTLPEGEGKLFIFDKSDTYGFWMKDMRFPIDMMWFDAQGELVHTAHSVTPESFPDLFAPETPALYVLEVNAGVSAASGFKSGSHLILGEELTLCLKESCFIE